MSRVRACSLGGVLLVAGLAWASPQDQVLRVHEWGTFTSLQDETGRALGGINSDDEPLPEFVHSIQEGLIAHSSDRHVAHGGKGVPFMMPSATMRLETPVLYFYPPAQARLPMEIDVRVEFRGGWLTQFYPDAIVQAPGLRQRPAQLTAATVGRLEWRGLEVGGTREAQFPSTQSGVWLAPRGVGAAPVEARRIAKPDATESEKYLFYRGIGNLDAPLKVVREADKLSISPAGNLPRTAGDLKVTTLWLADVREDGLLAFREFSDGPIYSSKPTGTITTSANFQSADYASGNLRRLRDSMHKALVADGLFADEAYALLNTWEQSYFKTPGLRLFYLVPQAWTDYHLPLTLSVPAEVRRVMVARTEIVTPAQRELIRRLQAGRSGPDRGRSAEQQEAYRRLGRFREALLADQNQRPERAVSSAMEKDDRYRDRDTP